MLSDIVEGWNEHLNDGLECLADIPREDKQLFKQCMSTFIIDECTSTMNVYMYMVMLWSGAHCLT